MAWWRLRLEPSPTLGLRGHECVAVILTIHADGSQTDTFASANGTVLSVTSVTTNANGLTVTTSSPPYATARYASETIDATTLNADGGPTETTSDYNYEPTLIDETVLTTSADSLSSTRQEDLNGGGAMNQATTDFTVLNASGSQTEIGTDYTGNTNGTVRDVTTRRRIFVSGAASRR